MTSIEFIYFVSLLIPCTMLCIGVFNYVRIPKGINKDAGYRTIRSMQNQTTWKYANCMFARFMIVFGMILLIVTIIVLHHLETYSSNVLVTNAVIFLFIQIGTMILPIVMTEVALKHKFDANGHVLNDTNKHS